MSTLTEIEAAFEKLPPSEQTALFDFVSKRLGEAGGKLPQARRELLAKWRSKTTDFVERCGGTQGYLNAIRERDDDCR